ncbi:MAG: iron-sulfur cluster carrier protein ApbC [Chloroflexi bacterium]|nr:iron-sulfur cluster carrier protein ApbC [Chloroflexota bacterium]
MSPHSNNTLTREAVMDVLRTVNDPELHRDLVSLGMIKQVEITDGRVKLEIQLTTPACPLRETIGRDVEAALRPLSGFQGVDIDFSSNVAGRALADRDLVPGVRNIIAVASGKGGVGKSTVALNLALSLAKTGAAVGLLDADIYGPNIPTMMGVAQPPRVENNKMVPIEKFGIKMISMGILVPDDSPIIWRGPMLNNALRQFFGDVVWGELDYLVIDMPPGTGDVHISLVQLVQVTGAVIVTTPQTVSLNDARKGLAMFQQTNTPVLGIIENMSYFICGKCGERHDIFDTGGGRRVAEDLDLPFLGAIPIGLKVREGGDRGEPIVIAEPESEPARQFMAIAGNLAARVSVTNLDKAPPIEIKLGKQ